MHNFDILAIKLLKKIIKILLFPYVVGYYKFAFSSKWYAVFFNPFFFARKNLHKNISELCGNLSGRVLDVGCGSKPYKKMILHTDYIGLEFDTPENRVSKQAEYFYDGVYFPLKDAEFDSILTTQVLEHVFTPEIFVAELNRVLKPEGKLLLTVPFVWDEHEQPYDFGRYSSFGLKALLERHGFEIIEQRKTCNDITLFFQLWNDYLYKKIYVKESIILLQIVIFLCSISNIIGVFLNVFFPKNDDLYLDNIVLAEKVARNDRGKHIQ